MADPIELMLGDLKDRYAAADVSEDFARLYREEASFGSVFASLHEQLNHHFAQINDRAKSTHHYWADNSRSMIALIEEVEETLQALTKAGIDVVFLSDYRDAINRCEPWLSPGGGSTIPDGFEPIPIVRYEAVFTVPATSIRLQKRQQSTVQLNLLGEGSYSFVYWFADPDYGKKFALKRAKKGLDERDLVRFRQEFNVLSSLCYPYVVEVYQYNEVRNEYTMEFCDVTLRTYISTRNNTLSFPTRKRVAIQFLYGLNYIHKQGLLHRDISLQNVLIKLFDAGAVLVKLSDFGLVKEQNSTFTRTQTEMRGTIRDPHLQDFKSYSVLNEIYCVGFILAYIFTGKESLAAGGDIGRIVQKCTDADLTRRYQRVIDIISDIEGLNV